MRKLLVVSLIGLIGMNMVACGFSEGLKDGIEDTKTEASMEKGEQIVLTEEDRGTSEYLNAIYYYVKENKDLKNKEKEAYDWIVNNYKRELTSYDEYEKGLYYGYILSRYSKDDDRKCIGDQYTMFTKYLYRGQSIEESGKEFKIKRIEKILNKIE